MGKRILVVDDNAPFRQMLSVFLKSQGYHVDLADDVAAAIKALDFTIYDLILSDKNMKGTEGGWEGGIDLLNHAQTMFSPTPVIIMTGDPTVQALEEALKLGAVDFLHKPFSLWDLSGKIKKILT